MSATAILPAPAPTVSPAHTGWPREPKWTVEQFHAMNALGLFRGRRLMLIHGVILEQGSMNEPHGTAVEKVTERVRLAFGPGWRVRGQLPLVLGLKIDPMPDLAVLSGDSLNPVRGHPTTAALVVEISDTTLTYDMTEKAELYATANVPEYWVLDLNARVLHVYRDPTPLPNNLGAVAYSTHLTFSPTDTVSPLAAPNSIITVADLLP